MEAYLHGLMGGRGDPPEGYNAVRSGDADRLEEVGTCQRVQHLTASDKPDLK